MSDVTNTFYAGEAFIGYGAQLLIGQDDGSPETFVAVAGVTKITPGEMSANIINKTHLRSPGRAHEKISTLRDIGPFGIEGNLMLAHGSQNNAGGDGFTPLNPVTGEGGGLIAIHRAQAERNMRITVITDPSDGTTVTIPFRGVVSKFQIGEIGLENLVSFTAEVQPLSDYTADLP